MKRAILTVLLVAIVVFCSLENSVQVSAGENAVVYDDPRDDFYIDDGNGAMLMYIAVNDGNNPGWGNLDLVQHVQNGIYANQGGFSQYFTYSPNSNFYGLDTFRYRYQTSPGVFTAAAWVSNRCYPTRRSPECGTVLSCSWRTCKSDKWKCLA